MVATAYAGGARLTAAYTDLPPPATTCVPVFSASRCAHSNLLLLCLFRRDNTLRAEVPAPRFTQAGSGLWATCRRLLAACVAKRAMPAVAPPTRRAAPAAVGCRLHSSTPHYAYDVRRCWPCLVLLPPPYPFVPLCLGCSGGACSILYAAAPCRPAVALPTHAAATPSGPPAWVALLGCV